MKKTIMIALVAFGGLTSVACNREYEEEGVIEPGTGGAFDEGVEPLGEERELEEGEPAGNIDQRNDNEGVFESPNERRPED